MGIDSLKIRGKLIGLVKTQFNSGNRLGSFFHFKDKVPLNARSLILYKFTLAAAILHMLAKLNGIFW